MRKFLPSLSIPLVLTIASIPVWAESQTKPKRNQEDAGVQEAIAFQRAKDRADAAQARKESRHPEHFTYAQPQPNGPDGLATGQRKAALEHSSKAPATENQK